MGVSFVLLDRVICESWLEQLEASFMLLVLSRYCPWHEYERWHVL